MSTILVDEKTEQTVPQSVNSDADNALSATEAEQAKLDEYRAAENRVVDLAIATLDPKDMLKKYAKLGKAGLDLATKRRDSLAPGAWNGKEDFEKCCDDVGTLVKMRVAIKEVRMATYVRVYLWVEAVKALVPDVERLSYFQVANKMLPTLQFDATELTGEIRKDWLSWVRVTVERQLNDSPMSIKDLDASIKERKEEIETERKRNSKRTPEQVLEAEQRAANKKLLAERSAAQSKVSNAVSDALVEGKADVADILAVVKQAVDASNVPQTRGVLVFDADKITIEDCKGLASLMCASGKLAEMKYLRDRLDAMIKIAENAMVTSKTA
jgi:hypothetical protein